MAKRVAADLGKIQTLARGFRLADIETGGRTVEER